MIVKVLVDNTAGSAENCPKLCGEWGLSVHVEFEGGRYLLDTGATGLFVRNAASMGVDLSLVDMGILSHAHYDHAGGLAAFFEKNKAAPFYLRAGTDENCYHTHRIFGPIAYHEYIGIHYGWLRQFASRIEFVEGDRLIDPNVYLIPHSTPGLEAIGKMAHLSVKEGGKYRDDSFKHEQSLVFDTMNGLVVMNSCCHAGADNIVKEIETAFPGKKIYALLGGFHLFRYPDKLVCDFAERLRALGVKHIYTGHCTGDNAFDILREILGERVEKMYTGMSIEI